MFKDTVINWSFAFHAILDILVVTHDPSAIDLRIERIYGDIVFEPYKQTLIRVNRFNIIELPEQLMPNSRGSFFKFFYSGKMGFKFFGENIFRQLAHFFKFVVD